VSLIYHITSRAAAQNLRLTGEYRPESLQTEGFIHFSQPHQVLDVANAFYRGQQSLVLLIVEPSRLEAELKYEPPAHPSASEAAPAGDLLFPHLYGPLNMGAVLEVVDFPPGTDGSFAMPDALK